MIKLVRLDYRLLHGQVVFSWTGHVGAQRIIVVDDDAANDEMKKSALLLSKPAGVRVNIFTVDKAIAKMPKVEQPCLRLIITNTRCTMPMRPQRDVSCEPIFLYRVKKILVVGMCVSWKRNVF